MIEQMTQARSERRSDVIAAQLAGHAGHARQDLDREGLVRLAGVISADWLSVARTDVDGYIARHGSGEHSLVDADDWECPTISEFAEDERVEAFLHGLTSLSAKPGYAGYRQRVLRILDGSAVDSPPFDWHYDANAVTMLVPLVIPDDGTGHVAMFPDHRPHRRWATLSAAERLLVHNKRYGRRLRQRYDSDPTAFTVAMTPGDVYLFRGYRALHATLPWPSDTLRATLILQYGHPYGPESSLVQAVRARRAHNRRRRAAHHNSAR
jgi:transposase